MKTGIIITVIIIIIANAALAQDNYTHRYDRISRIETPFGGASSVEKDIGFTFGVGKTFSCSAIDWGANFRGYFSSRELQKQMKYVIDIIAEAAAAESLHFLLQSYPSLAHVIEFYIAQGRAMLSLDVQKCEILERALRENVHDALIADCVNKKVASGMSISQAQEACREMSSQTMFDVNVKLSDALKKIFPHATGAARKDKIAPPVEDVTNSYKAAFDKRLKAKGAKSGVAEIDELPASYFELLSFMPPETQAHYAEKTSRFVALIQLEHAYKQIEAQGKVSSNPEEVALAHAAHALREQLTNELELQRELFRTRQIISEYEKPLAEYVNELVQSRVGEIARQKSEERIRKSEFTGLAGINCCKR